MTTTIAYTPPDLDLREVGQVRRRHILYFPGYDPEARTRYRLLFVRELLLYAKRFGQTKREVSRPVLTEEGLLKSWTIAAHPETGGVETTYDVLLWDDIVVRDFKRSRFITAALLIASTMHALCQGLLFSYYRHNWKCGNVTIYPFVMMMLLGIATGLVAVEIHALLGHGYDRSIGLPGWISIPAGILVGLGLIAAAESLLARIYFWQLVNDWIFNWQHSNGLRGDYEQRLNTFAEIARRRIAAIDHCDEDEIVLIGHSTGALTAVEVAARLLQRDPDLGARGPTLALVTLGSALPIVALQRRAVRVRADIARLVGTQRIVWVDYVAPQDWLNFPDFRPLQHLDLELLTEARIANPVVRSARFRDIISEETYRKVRWRPFRMHFQFLMANDREGAYDFFAMTLGPQRVVDRAFNGHPDDAIPASPDYEAVAA